MYIRFGPQGLFECGNGAEKAFAQGSGSAGAGAGGFGTHASTLSRPAFKPLPVDTYMLSYKYLIVLAGVVTAGRLATFLAHSGAVIMLQVSSI